MPFTKVEIKVPDIINIFPTIVGPESLIDIILNNVFVLY
ncbi:hypothetical protein LCGC14_2826870, partial [marine sediment metagenome]